MNRPTLISLLKYPLIQRFQQDFHHYLMYFTNSKLEAPASPHLVNQQVEITLPYYLTEVYFTFGISQDKRDTAYEKCVEGIYRLINLYGFDPETLLQSQDGETRPLYLCIVEEMLSVGSVRPYTVGNQSFQLISEYLFDVEFRLEGDYLYVYSDIRRVIERMVDLEQRANKLEEENAKYRQLLSGYRNYFTGKVNL